MAVPPQIAKALNEIVLHPLLWLMLAITLAAVTLQWLATRADLHAVYSVLGVVYCVWVMGLGIGQCYNLS
jgi:hypothetical protein